MAETSPTKGFLAGGFGGVCVVLVGHPLDTMKVLGSLSSYLFKLLCLPSALPPFWHAHLT